MSIFVFRFSMSKIKMLEILVVLVDGKYAEVMKRGVSKGKKICHQYEF